MFCIVLHQIFIKHSEMKNLLFIAFMLLMAWACSPQKDISKASADIKQVVIDSTEYEITIFDTDFDRWYLLHFSPALDRSNDYYRLMNDRGVTNWNQYFTRNRYNQVVNSYINFNPTIDYGMEVNRKLYWYFRFIEETCKIKLFR